MSRVNEMYLPPLRGSGSYPSNAPGLTTSLLCGECLNSDYYILRWIKYFNIVSGAASKVCRCCNHCLKVSRGRSGDGAEQSIRVSIRVKPQNSQGTGSIKKTAFYSN